MFYTYLVGWSTHDRWYYGCQYKNGADPSKLWNGYYTSSKIVKRMVKSHGQPDVIQIRRTFKCPKRARYWEHRLLRRINASQSIRWLNLKNGYGDNKVGIADIPKTTKDANKPNNRFGLKWYNNGKAEIKVRDHPGLGWNIGRLWSPSDDQRKLSSKIHKGNSYNKGKTQSAESNAKRSQSLKGRILTAEHKHKISIAHTGKIISEETIQKTKESKNRNGTNPVGEKNPMFGKTHSDEAKIKIGVASRKRKKPLR